MKSLISTEMKTAAAAAPAHWGKIFYEEAYPLINNTMVSVITVQPTLNTIMRASVYTSFFIVQIYLKLKIFRMYVRHISSLK